MMQDMEVGQISDAFRLIIKALGMDADDPNLIDTPGRVARMLLEMTNGQRDTDERAGILLGVTFSSKSHDEMIIVKGIEVNSLCPHHFLSILYDVAVGYLPRSPDYHVVGLSKIPRLVELLASRAVLQEDFTSDITRYLQKYLNPVGSGVIVKGRHGCLSCRGAKQRNAVMQTSSLMGIFRDNDLVKREFMILAAEK